MTDVTTVVHDHSSAYSIFQVPHFLKATHLLVTCQDKKWFVHGDNTPGKMDFHFLIELLD